MKNLESMNIFVILYSSCILASFNGGNTGPVTYEGLRDVLATFANRLNLTIEQNLTESEQRTLRNVKNEIDTLTKEELDRRDKYFSAFADIIKATQTKTEDTKEKTPSQQTNSLQGLLPILASSLGSGNNNDLIMYILFLLNSNQSSSSSSASGSTLNPNMLNSLLPILAQRLNQGGLGNTFQNPLTTNLQGNLLGLLGPQNLQGGINPLIIQSLLGASTPPGSNLDPNQLFLLNILLGLLKDNTTTQECKLETPTRPTNICGISVPQSGYGPSVPQSGYGPSVPQGGYGPSVPVPPQIPAAACKGASCNVSDHGVETREYGRNYGRRP
jgi:hypothetical protein